MEETWAASALWVSLALASSLVSIRLAISVALVEIVVGAVAGNTIGLEPTAWANYLAGAGAILLTFLAGAEVDPAVIRKHFWPSMTIGAMGFAAPFAGVLAWTHWVSGWPWPQAEIAGISLSTTSVAVVYAVMVETGYNRTELGKVVLAACFVNDLGTVLALGVLFANYDAWLAVFGGATALAMVAMPRVAPWFFRRVGGRVSEPETKLVLAVLFGLGALACRAKSEAVLPAYLIGMVMAPCFLAEKVLAHRMRVIAFALLTPFYFLKAGSLVRFDTVVSAAGLVGVLLGVKMLTKFAGIWPLTRTFRFKAREGMFTILLMSTGLTFGTISALFGLTNGIISQEQYTVLVTAVIGSAVVPTVIAQKWFQPKTAGEDGEAEDAQEGAGGARRVGGVVQGASGGA